MWTHGFALLVALAATAPADSFEASVLADRAATVRSFHEDAQSPLATVLRRDFPADGGWLTVGAAPDNAVVLADSTVAPHHLRVRVAGQGFRAEAVDSGARFTVAGEPRATADLGPGALGVGRHVLRLSYQNAPAVIVFDPRQAARSGFRGPTYWPYDRRYRCLVPLLAESRADTVRVESTHGQPRRALRVGRFTLRLPTGTARLAAYRLLEPGVGAESLALFFMDATCGRGSYHGGRYLDVERQPDGRYLVDLNRCYNPSCAYSPHYNCPVPPLENRLRLAVRAGESWPDDAAGAAARAGTPGAP